jgi:anti-sigma regulatory factor (Ser/Thr protein kinase)
VSNQQALGESRHRLLDGRPDSSREVRATVSDVLTAWGSEELVHDAVLGAAELASNVILHAGTDYELVIRPLPFGARIEIIDRRPDLVPTTIPATPAASALTDGRTTGRGLQIVATLASRWGYTTSAMSKSVWMEITEAAPLQATEPVVDEGHRETVDPAARMFHFESMPVRAAVGSGVQVEELIREVQLAGSSVMDEKEFAELRQLLDSSAPARLLGRHAAFSAAAKEQPRFSIDVRLAPRAIAALRQLNAMLTETSARLDTAVVPLPPQVIDFRAWLLEELARQVSGEDPLPCPLPD